MTFDHLPAVHFGLAADISHDEALRLLSEPPPPGAQVTCKKPQLLAIQRELIVTGIVSDTQAALHTSGFAHSYADVCLAPGWGCCIVLYRHQHGGTYCKIWFLTRTFLSCQVKQPFGQALHDLTGPITADRQELCAALPRILRAVPLLTSGRCRRGSVGDIVAC